MQLAVANNIKELVNRADIAKMFSISPSTLYHRVSMSKSSHYVKGWHHAGGCKRCPCVLKKGKCTSLQALLHLILSTCKGVIRNWLSTYLYHFQVFAYLL